MQNICTYVQYYLKFTSLYLSLRIYALLLYHDYSIVGIYHVFFIYANFKTFLKIICICCAHFKSEKESLLLLYKL